MRRPVCCFAAAFSVIMYLVILLFPAADTVDERAEGRYVTLTGTAEWIEEEIPRSGEEEEPTLRLSLGKPVIESGIPGEIAVQVHRDDKVLCRIHDDVQGQASLFGIGARIRIRGKVKLFRRASNDGEFDAFLYYGCMQGYLFTLEEAQVLAYTREADPLRSRLYDLRNFLSGRIDDLYRDRHGKEGRRAASALKAMLLGQTGLLDPELKETYQVSGIVHVLCISGLHISLLGMGIHRFFGRLGAPAPLSAFPAALAVVLYGIMTGMHTSCLRAMIMFVMHITAKGMGRTYDLLTAMSAAAVLLLLEQPYYILSGGFLFSFSAVAAAAIALPSLPRAFKAVAIPLFTIPVHLAFYYTFPPYSVFLSVIAIALMPAVMAGGTAGTIFSSVACLCSGNFAGTAAGCASALAAEIPFRILQLYDWGASLTQKLPFSSIIAGKPPRWEIPVYYVMILSALLIPQIPNMHRYMRRTIRTGTAVLALLMIFGLRPQPPLSFYMLDVGQGDGMCIQTGREGGGLTFLIDGGSSSRQKLGQYTLLPFLKYRGISCIDCCIITHDDLDHCSGVLELMDAAGQSGGIRIGCIAMPSVDEKCRGETYKRILDAAAKRSIPVTYLSRGMVLESGRLSLECLHPQKGAAYGDANSCSVVLCLRYGSFSALLTGDIEGEGEKELIRYIGSGHIDTDVYKVAHHGSGNASSKEFLERIRFDKALISCGRNNRYGHPAQETLDRIREKNAEILDTRETGRIRVTTDGEGGFSVDTFY